MQDDDQLLLLLIAISVLFPAGFHFFCSLGGEFRFLNPKMLGYPGEYLVSTRLNCLLIVSHAVKLKLDDVARRKI